MKNIYSICIAVTLILALTAGMAAAQDTQAKLGLDPSKSPVKITSDRMVYDENGRTVTFEGNVVAHHADLTLWSKKLVAHLADTSKQGNSESIERIVATGNVRAEKGKSKGSCGLLTYYVDRQHLKMEQNPQLQDGPNNLTGNIINFYSKENRTEVVGGKGKRVKAIFLAPSSGKVK